MSSSIHFGPERYEAIRQTYRKWWAGELDRPIVPITTGGHESNRAVSNNPDMTFETSWDWSIAPEQFVDRQDYDLSTVRFHGDAFPMAAPTRFGAGALAALLGCKPVSSKHTVWFMPPEENIPLKELHFEYREDTPAFQRIMRYYEAAIEKWQGSVIVKMFDLGGVSDVLASFRGTENLLMDLYDEPEEVIRCLNEIQDMWFRYFKRFNDVLKPTANGYSYWYGLYNEEPGYILQSDFCYMIGPKMFDEFIEPELRSSADRLYNAVYHMDGVGQIPHLDSLLKIDSIKGYQWQPGEGEMMSRDWTELNLRILDAGKKLISLFPNADGELHKEYAMNKVSGLPKVYDKYLPQLYIPRGFHANDIEKAKAYGDRYGVEVKL